jgi:hypothetical protein
MSGGRTPFPVIVSEKMAKHLTKIAKKEGKTVQQVVIDAVETWMKIEDQKEEALRVADANGSGEKIDVNQNDR